jgi:uncharacterized Ntn-hydrolase superfamily protein
MTLTIVAREADTGRLGLAQATNPMGVASRCAFVQANVAALSTQAYTTPELGPIAMTMLEAGLPPAKVLDELAECDPDFSWRQVGIVDWRGRSAVHTGEKVKEPRGGHAGPDFVAMGNFLSSENVVPAMEKAWRDSRESLFEWKLLRALEAGRDAGGDAGGHRSAALIVHHRAPYPPTDLRVDFVPKREGSPDAVDTLFDIFRRWEPLMDFYRDRPSNPAMGNWQDWLRTAKGVQWAD